MVVIIGLGVSSNPFYFFVTEILFVTLGGECLAGAFCWFLQFFLKRVKTSLTSYADMLPSSCVFHVFE